MSDADNESSDVECVYAVYKTSVTYCPSRSLRLPTMWTPSVQKKHRHTSDEEEQTETTTTTTTKQEHGEREESREKQYLEMFHRLANSLDRNTEVMQAAMDTMDQISTISNRTMPLPDDELIIPDRKRWQDKIKTFLNHKKLDSSNLKDATDNKVDVDKMGFTYNIAKKNIETKEENGGYQHFLPLSQYFPKPIFSRMSKPGLVWERVNLSNCGTLVIFSEMFHRLANSLDRNTEVMQAAMDTMDQISTTSNRTMPLPDDELIIPDRKRDDRAIVEVKCTFLKISDIDTINQQFEAEVFVQAKWEEPLLQQMAYGQNESFREEIEKIIPWDPKLIVMNVDGAFMLNRKTFDIRFHEPGYNFPVVMQLWRFKGFFKENLELEHFPVDVQDLTISISTERPDKEIELIEDQTALSSINTKAFMDQEWNLYKHAETYRDFTTVEYCSSTVHPILHIQCRVARKMGYFVWNIIFIMLLISSLTFAAFTIDYSSADRITVTITLFLTAVAFKLVVKQSLPTISYLTYLDIYVIAALIFLGLQVTQNACMNAMGNFMTKAEVQYNDKLSMVIMASLLFFFHLFFAMYIYWTASKRRRIMEEKDKIYTSKREFLEKYGSLPTRYDTAAEDFDSFIPGRKLKSLLPR